MINAFKGYLWTLKTCHSGADMDTAAEMAKGHLDGDTTWMLFDMLQNRLANVVCLKLNMCVCGAWQA
jgi:alpha-glucan,water dikinase